MPALYGFEERFAWKIKEEKRLLREKVAAFLKQQYESTGNPFLRKPIAYFLQPV
jgi:hypothetical protein